MKKEEKVLTSFEIIEMQNEKIKMLSNRVRNLEKYKRKREKIKDFIITTILIMFSSICMLDFITAIMIKLYRK